MDLGTHLPNISLKTRKNNVIMFSGIRGRRSASPGKPVCVPQHKKKEKFGNGQQDSRSQIGQRYGGKIH